jgi:hypothetical protein
VVNFVVPPPYITKSKRGGAARGEGVDIEEHNLCERYYLGASPVTVHAKSGAKVQIHVTYQITARGEDTLRRWAEQLAKGGAIEVRP